MRNVLDLSHIGGPVREDDILDPDERDPFVTWMIGNICYRKRTKRGPQQLVSKHMVRAIGRRLRGSDQTECVWICIKALLRSGCSQKESCLIVAEKLPHLGGSQRGRPTKLKRQGDLLGRAEIVRSMFNAFNDPTVDGLVGHRIGMFRRLTADQELVDGKYPPDSGYRSYLAWRVGIARQLGQAWPDRHADSAVRTLQYSTVTGDNARQSEDND